MIATPVLLRPGSVWISIWGNPTWNDATNFVWIVLPYAAHVSSYWPASLITQNAFVAFVPTYVKHVRMNARSLTVKFASNARKNVVPVPRVVKKWQLKKEM
jgi:hypothetical protein